MSTGEAMAAGCALALAAYWVAFLITSGGQLP